jgi:hypothetical protein
MSTATRFNSSANDLSRTAKKSTCETSPSLSSGEMHLSAVVSQTILFAGDSFETVLLPYLADNDPGEGLMGGVQGGDGSVWSDYMR